MELEFVFNKVLRLGVHINIFELLAVNELLSNNQKLFALLLYLYFLFLHFLYNLFFTNEDFEQLNMKKDHSMKSSGSGNQKVFLSICWWNIYVWTLIYEAVCACGFECLRTFVRIFEMYEFSAANFIKILSYQSFDVKYLLTSCDVCVYEYVNEW